MIGYVLFFQTDRPSEAVSPWIVLAVAEPTGRLSLAAWQGLGRNVYSTKTSALTGKPSYYYM